MSILVYLARTARRRWRSHVAIALLLGVAAGVGLFALAGARRTQSSYARFLREGNASTMSVATSGGYDEVDDAALATLPEVAESRTYVNFYVNVMVDGRPDFSQAFESSGTFDGLYFDQDRFTVTNGRMADRARADEVMVNEFGAKRFGYRVGQQLQLGLYSLDQFTAPTFFADPPAPGKTSVATIVGIGLFSDEVIQDDGDRSARMVLTPAYSEAARGFENFALQGLVLHRGDADVAAVRAAIEARFGPGAAEVNVTSETTLHASHALSALATALAAFGAVLGLATLALVSQALSRTLRASREDRRMLTVFGASRRTVIVSALPGPLLAVLAGTVLAVLVAVAASPAMPIGPVRRVEVHRGFDVDLAVMLLGAVTIVVLLGTWIVAVLWRDARRHAQRTRAVVRPSRVVSVVADAHASTPAVMGLRFTVGRDDNARVVSMRSVMSGAALAIAAVTASITFSSSLDTLVSTPSLYGWQWDSTLVAGNGYGNIDPARTADVLGTDPAVDSWSGAYVSEDRLDDHVVQLLGMEPAASVTPPFLRGRMIQSDDEVVLGSATASALDKDVGDTVTLTRTGQQLRVAGVAVFPSIGKTHVAHPSLGDGAIIESSLVPGYLDDITGETMAQTLGPQVVFVRYTDGTDAAAQLTHLRQTTAPLAGFAGLDVVAAQRPAEIVHATDIGNAPRVLAIGLAAAALLSLVLGLVTSVRSRVRDLALLRALGFSQRQLAAAVSWHATAVIAVGVGLGVPIGVVLGRVAWRQFSTEMSVVARPDVPVGTIVALAVGALVVVNLVAIVPARHAQRVSAAQALRSG